MRSQHCHECLRLFTRSERPKTQLVKSRFFDVGGFCLCIWTGCSLAITIALSILSLLSSVDGYTDGMSRRTLAVHWHARVV